MPQDTATRTERTFEVLAGTKLAARNRMAQVLPFLLEVSSNQALVAQLAELGWKVNAMELANIILDMSEMKNNPAVIKAQYHGEAPDAR